MIRQHKIPTILGLLTLIMGLVIGVFLVQGGQVFFLRAAPEISPSQVKITNLTSNSFSVSWLTEKETNGFVKFGETSSLEQTALDDRDQMTGKNESFVTHHVTVKNLKPKTHYLFKISSGGRFFDKEGQLYEVTTAPVLTIAPPASDIASGIILNPDGSPAAEVIVYLTLANTTPQSTLVRSGGNWFIPLNTALSADLSSFAQYDKEAQIEEIFVQGSQGQTATVLTTTGNDNPVPEITLGKAYDFRQKVPEEQLTPTPTPMSLEETPSSLGGSRFSFPSITPSPPSETELSITNPLEEGEKLNTQKPEFAGTGPAGKTIQILVESPSYNGNAVVKNDGSWSWTPPTGLPPGEHKITISYLGKTLTRTFTVLAAGTSETPSFTATPSATLAPSPTPTKTATASPTPTATASARTSMPSTAGGVPTSGDLTPTFLVSIMGLGLILSGFVVKSRLTR